MKDLNFTFNIIISKVDFQVQVRYIELLNPFPTFRIVSNCEFLGYIERTSPFQYRQLSNSEISSDIITEVVSRIESALSEADLVNKSLYSC